ncbi:MAG: type II toxin-antitoxin system VapB family antitoxin [Chloroflexi bacterium]|nr:type II toxin-antitoxin system VapB family antitoxin [Chloroflexota bacterium]MCI0580815.1 type II toxin-antitoxin system VapB family antitoxin [Chloroflexota bacterium]MCI0648191.1 type II toxin-antitoxin system VapB family antitoxin [Chloroflexota bacterium]MCI0730333.1 type II toxin-antitoxin system VapB family antitoxin [Chloroflexota bacterium]
MRTNIVIDDDLIAEAMALTGISTKREVVELALRTLIRLEQQRAILALEGTVGWEGNLDAWRQARYLAEAGDEYDDDPG